MMAIVRTIPALMLMLAVLLPSARAASAAEESSFRLGFKALADQISEVAGQPLENEHYAANGDSLQKTTTGLMVWRKADNWTAFTDGNTTWINGPEGMQSRSNGERFGWELATPERVLGIDPQQVRLDTRGLPFPSYRVDRVGASAYDVSTPPGPKGLPEHLSVGFGLIDQPGPRAYLPVMYIVPTESYAQLWEQNGNRSVTKAISRIQELAQQIPSPTPIRGMPLLPYELTTGVNDLAVQIKPVIGGENSALGTGFRYVGRFAQDANPVTDNGRLCYIYQGFTRDGRYLVSFSCDVYTTSLPEHGQVPQAVQEKFASDYRGYMQETAAMLNSLPGSAWEPDLEKLDAFVTSLRLV
ncbi:MAG TPA: hypothetical protein VHS06_08255, partial [Chloroflexota bacterium]|nr:hypothetical protein [Chloroflexota bacterium]